MIIDLLFKEFNKLYPKFYFDFFPKFVFFINNILLYTFVLDNLNSILELLEFYIKNKIFLDIIDYNLDYISYNENNKIIKFKTNYPIDFFDVICISDSNKIYLLKDFIVSDEVNLIYNGEVYIYFPLKNNELKNIVFNLYVLKKFIINEYSVFMDDFSNSEIFKINDFDILKNPKNINYLNVIKSELYSSNLEHYKKIKINKNLKYFYYVNK